MLQSEVVRVHPNRKLDAVAGNADTRELLCNGQGSTISGIVATKGHQDFLHCVLLAGREVLVGEPVVSGDGGDVLEPGAPDGKAVDQRLAEDHRRGRERLAAPDATRATRKLCVIGGALADRAGDLAAVDLNDAAVLVEDRDDDRTPEEFVAGPLQDPDPLEALADLAPGVPRLVGDPVAERPVSNEPVTRKVLMAIVVAAEASVPAAPH